MVHERSIENGVDMNTLVSRCTRRHCVSESIKRLANTSYIVIVSSYYNIPIRNMIIYTSL